MALTSNEISETKNDEINSSSSDNKLPMEQEDEEHIDTPLSTINDEEQQQSSTSIANELEEELPPIEKPLSISSDEINKENRKNQFKTRSVSFAPTVEEYEIPARSSFSSNCSTDFIDALVESYKLQTSVNLYPYEEQRKYVPKTTRTRLNPNWREHRMRRLMNKLEELSLWDREEELKASQAQSLREQKWEQIQDRQRNHDLCLNLMRQRHESEMESAVLLDRGANGINDENTSASIARAMNLASPANVLAYDLPTPPQTLKRRVRQDQEKSSELKTPIGRYRQFETNMSNKLEKINQKLQPDHEIMRAYSPYRTSIPPTAVPLFSETYATLLSVPDTYSSNKYNRYHYGVAPYLHQSQHAPSPDYETRPKSYSNRDVRVPLKEQSNDYNYYDDDNTDEYYRSNPIDDDHYTKYRSNSNDYYTKYRSNLIDDDQQQQRKYHSNPIDEDYQSKYRSNSINDDDYYSKYRSKPVEDDYYTKYRSSLSSRLDYSPPRRTTSLASPTASSLYDCSTVVNTPREYSLIHSSQPVSNSIHLRSLNDDLNARTRL